MNLSRSIALALERLMLRTDHTPLRRIWMLAHECAIHVIAFTLARRVSASVFVKGSFGYGEPVFGISDIDMIAVLPTRGDPGDDAAEIASLRSRWLRIVRRFPPLGELFHVFFYSDAELCAAASAPCLTYDLGEPTPRAAFLGPRPVLDEMGLLERPELYGPTREWRPIRGAVGARLPPPSDMVGRCLSAWLELQFWWRYVFPVCIDPEGPRLPSLCVKLVAEPVRILLFLVHGEEIFSRAALLRRALSALPEEEPALRRAIDLQRELPRSPSPPLAEVLADLVRLSVRVADELGRQLAPSGFTEVDLDADAGEPVTGAAAARAARAALGWAGPLRWLPLVDWRSRTVPGPPDDVFAVVPGRVDDPAVVAAAALASEDGAYLALRERSLLVLPAARAKGRGRALEPEESAARFHRAKLRGVQCAETDPVSFALAEGRSVARFPNVPGWSSVDSARRAVAEHAGWLAGSSSAVPPRAWVAAQLHDVPATAAALGRLFTAARAAIFRESVETSRPELPLSVRATAAALSDRAPSARALVDEAFGEYAAWRAGGQAPTEELVGRIEQLVRSLPPYESYARS